MFERGGVASYHRRFSMNVLFKQTCHNLFLEINQESFVSTSVMLAVRAV
jgi:hypothetical protein